MRRKPYCVILFDEIEKAHPDVFNMLLQILEDGILTDSQGRRVDFKNAVIIMTSNVGARMITEKKQLGFGTGDGNARSNEEIREDVMGELRRAFRPEFLNRIDDIIVFTQLTQPEIEEIARRMLQSLARRAKDLEVDISFDESAVQYVSKAGFDPVYGARPLRRTIQNKIEDALSEKLLDKSIDKSKPVTVVAENDKIEFRQ